MKMTFFLYGITCVFQLARTVFQLPHDNIPFPVPANWEWITPFKKLRKSKDVFHDLENEKMVSSETSSEESSLDKKGHHDEVTFKACATRRIYISANLFFVVNCFRYENLFDIKIIVLVFTGISPVWAAQLQKPSAEATRTWLQKNCWNWLTKWRPRSASFKVLPSSSRQSTASSSIKFFLKRQTNISRFLFPRHAVTF